MNIKIKKTASTGSSNTPIKYFAFSPFSIKADTESKTVSYNEIIPDAILNEIVVTEKISNEEYSNEYGTFPSAVVDNPWFSDHIHQNGDDPLGMYV